MVKIHYRTWGYMEDIGIQNINRWIAFGNKFIFQNIRFSGYNFNN